MAEYIRTAANAAALTAAAAFPLKSVTWSWSRAAVPPSPTLCRT